MKTLELKLKKDVLIADAENVFNANNYTVEDGIQLITDNKIKSSIINENNIIK